MPSKTSIIYLGPLWEGSTALQRLSAFGGFENIEIRAIDTLGKPGPASLVNRIRHRLRWPADDGAINAQLIQAVSERCPDVVFVDSCRVVTRTTLLALRESGVERLAFYSPDDIVARHNSSRQLEACDDLWDVFFTTKTFNVPELRARGVRRPIAIGKSYDPELHLPWPPQQVGEDFERFDVVLVATFERERMQSVNHLAENGFTVGVYGDRNWEGHPLASRVSLHPSVYAAEYVRALHTGRLALCPLRKLNRDRITQRSMEIPACRRPMLAEKTDEHDAAFVDGVEYVGYSSDDELCISAGDLLADEPRRRALAEAGWRRACESGYSTDARARTMLAAIFA